MNVPTNLFMWIMACLPIIVLLLLLIKFQWGATEAAPIGLLITIVTAVAFYKADFELLASETAKGIWSALPILLIVWTAILLSGEFPSGHHRIWSTGGSRSSAFDRNRNESDVGGNPATSWTVLG